MGYDVFLLVTKDFVAQMLALVDGKGFNDIVIFYRDYFRTKKYSEDQFEISRFGQSFVVKT